jgi:hypothetical protein
MDQQDGQREPAACQSIKVARLPEKTLGNAVIEENE